MSAPVLAMASCLNAPFSPAEAQEDEGVRVEPFARGLIYPSSMAFLPDGRALVTEREGRLRLVSAAGAVSPPLGGVPAVVDAAFNGLLDITLHPKFSSNRLVFFTFSEPPADKCSTVVARARLTERGLEDVQVIFRQAPAYEDTVHNGSRLVFGPDETLYVTLGDRNRSTTAQDLSTHNGKIVRITADGAPAPGNPFFDRDGARPEIWAYGLRNPQGIGFEPSTGKLWAVDHGPSGGDELNVIQRGANYGWPLATAGKYEPYESPPPRLRVNLNLSALSAPVRTWTPSIAPSDLMFYTGAAFPHWRGDLFISGLGGKVLLRLRVRDGAIVSEERFLTAANERIRAVRQAPNGLLYVLTDNADGRILRLSPAT